MKTPLTYYGGKQLLAKEILGMMPKHKIYVEPYFGGGAVFFAKGRSACECINDINDRLITFYEVCQDEEQFSLLQNKVKNTIDSERYFLRAKRIWNHPDEATDRIELAWAVWLSTNLGYGGSPSSGWKWENGTSGSHVGIVMENYRKRFTSKIYERLKYVQISCRDSLVVIGQRDTKDTFFYLDPPYPGCEQKHYSGFGFDDLEQLLSLLTTIKGKFILSNFDSPMLQEYIRQEKWNVKIKDLPLRVANRITKGTKRKQEMLVYNYDIDLNLFDNV